MAILGFPSEPTAQRVGMTEREFLYYLQGYLEYNDEGLDSTQCKALKEKLDKMLTPPFNFVTQPIKWDNIPMGT